MKLINILISQKILKNLEIKQMFIKLLEVIKKINSFLGKKIKFTNYKKGVENTCNWF